MNMGIYIDIALLVICVMQTIKVAYLTKEVKRQWQMIDYVTKQANWQLEHLNSIDRRLDRMRRSRKQEKSNLE